MQPDTLIPNINNPQSWNRYSYVQNNPVILNDPTGHRVCSNIEQDGTCNEADQKLEDLLNYTDDKVLHVKGKHKHNSLKSMELVLRKAVALYGDAWNSFLDSTTFIFTGYYGHGASTMWKAHSSGFSGLIDGDSGFNSDFKDSSPQVRHFWAGFATAADPTGDNPTGEFWAYNGNDYHEITQDTQAGKDGATVTDYALTLTAIDIAKQAGHEIKTPMDLIGVLKYRLGTDGPGYTGQPIPREWWWTPDN